MMVEEYWKNRESQVLEQLARLRHCTQDDVAPAEWEALSERLSRDLAILHRNSVRGAFWRILLGFKCGGRSVQGAWWFAQDLLANGDMRLIMYAGNTGRPDFPYEMWALPPRNPDEDGTYWKGYQVRHFKSLHGARMGEPVVLFEHRRQLMSVIQLNNECNSDKRTRNKAYAVQLSNGWYCLDDIYFHQVNRYLPMLKPLVAEFRALASRQRRAIDRQAKIRSCELSLQEIHRLRGIWNAVQMPDEQMIEVLNQADLFTLNDPAKPDGLLLKGVPGTGKTMLARTLAEATRCNFIHVKLSDVKKPGIGQSAQEVSRIWKEAREKGPTIMFLDECERILGKRGSMEMDTIASDVVQAFLCEWDGNEKNVWVVAATNRPDLIDEAILSRFGWSMELRLPTLEARRNILCAELAKAGFTGEIPRDMDQLTQGLSGRDLAKVAKRVLAIAHPGLPKSADFVAAVRTHRGQGNTVVDVEARWGTLILDRPTLENLKTVCALLADVEGWTRQGVTIPMGMLLVGPPGVGKTQIARTLANEAGLSFIAATTADIKGQWIGESGRRVQSLFERVRAAAPAILFLDELDIIAPGRDIEPQDTLVKEIVGQLLQEMDGIRCQQSPVFVLGATNHADRIDSAIRSRMTHTIEVPLPDEECRRRLLTIMLEGKRVGFPIEAGCADLARQSQGMSGRDLRNWITKAEALGVMRAVGEGGAKEFLLRFHDFEAARGPLAPHTA